MTSSSSARYSRVSGTGSYLPPKRLSNAQLAEQLAADGVETSDEWIVARTGIKARHFAEADVPCSDLAVEAARHAIESAGLAATDIDLIIVATSTPDMVFPSTACIVQRKLGIVGCAAFDVQAVCSGFVYALTATSGAAKWRKRMPVRSTIHSSEVSMPSLARRAARSALLTRSGGR